MKRTTAAVLVLLGLALPALAQGMGKEQLKAYTWKSKVQVSINGDVKSLQVFQVSYDANGQQQKTPLSAQDTPDKTPRGPLRQRIAQKIEDRKKAYIEGLQQTLAAYSHLTPDELKKFMDGAQVTTLPNNNPPAIQMQGTGLVDPADNVTMLVSQQGKHPLSVTVQTTYQGDAVKMVLTYGLLDGSIPYPEHVSTTVPDQGLDLEVENFDYQKVE